MIFCFDIDNTICTTKEPNYAGAAPRQHMVDRINDYHRHGHRIIIFTARGSGTGIDWRQLTENQLESWGVEYDELLFGKPAADVYVDDKAVNAAEFEPQTQGVL